MEIMGKQLQNQRAALRSNPSSILFEQGCLRQVGLPPGAFLPSLPTDPEEESEDDPQLEGRDPDIWHVGFKISWDIETPGLAIPLHQGDCYFMLGNQAIDALLLKFQIIG